MVDIFSDARIVHTHSPEEVEFTLRAYKKDTRTDRIDYSNKTPGDLSVGKIANELSDRIVVMASDYKDIPAVLSNGELSKRQGSILWGCGVNSGVTLKDPDIRILRGPVSYRNAGVSDPGDYCDAKVLYPWSFGMRRSNNPEGIYMAPGMHDIGIHEYREELEKHGIRYIDPRTPFYRQITYMSSSRFVVTSSVTTLICCESMGVPVLPFIYTEDDTERYRDYFEGTERDLKNIVYYDFRKKFSISDIGRNENPVYNIRKLIETCPFYTLNTAVSSIYGWFGIER